MHMQWGQATQVSTLTLPSVVHKSTAVASDNEQYSPRRTLNLEVKSFYCAAKILQQRAIWTGEVESSKKCGATN